MYHFDVTSIVNELTKYTLVYLIMYYLHIWLCLVCYKVITERVDKLYRTKHVTICWYMRNCHVMKSHCVRLPYSSWLRKRMKIFASTYPNFVVKLFPLVVQWYPDPHVTQSDVSNYFFRGFIERKRNVSSWCTHGGQQCCKTVRKLFARVSYFVRYRHLVFNCRVRSSWVDKTEFCHA